MLVRCFDFEIQPSSTSCDVWTVDYKNLVCKVKIRSSELGEGNNYLPLPRRPHARRPFEWMCSFCGLCNASFQTICYRCSSPKAHSTIPDDWVCSRCRTHNFAQRISCYRCRAGKGFPNEQRKNQGANVLPSGTGGVRLPHSRSVTRSNIAQAGSPLNQGSYSNRLRSHPQQRQTSSLPRPAVPTFAPRSSNSQPPRQAGAPAPVAGATTGPPSPETARHKAGVAAWGTFTDQVAERERAEAAQIRKENDARRAEEASGIARESAPPVGLKETFRKTVSNGALGSRRVVTVLSEVRDVADGKNGEDGADGAGKAEERGGNGGE